MRYMLLVLDTEASWRSFAAWPAEDARAHLLFMRELDSQLRTAGELVGEAHLAGPEQATIVRAQSDGAPAVTTAPFPEGREFVARYWVVDCDSPERAIEIAGRVSAAPGRGGVPRNVPVEVRQVMSAQGEEM